MVAFGLALLGVEPQWNSRGIVSRASKRQPLDATSAFAPTRCSLRRDCFAICSASRSAGSTRPCCSPWMAVAKTIEREYPALDAGAARPRSSRSGAMATGGDEPIARNYVAAHWVDRDAPAHHRRVASRTSPAAKRACASSVRRRETTARASIGSPSAPARGPIARSWRRRISAASVMPIAPTARLQGATGSAARQPQHRPQHLSRPREQSVRPDG